MKGRHLDLESARRQVRIVSLLRAADVSGLAPIPILQLHALAYLSNVLAPVWNLQTMEGKLLKRRGGPFYPDFQRDLDRMVGGGIVTITRVAHVVTEKGRWRLEGSYQLNESFAERIVLELLMFSDERSTLAFIQELMFAASSLTDSELDAAVSEDATYMDPNVDIGSVIDFAEWQNRNFSANAAEYFEKVAAAGIFTTPGEKLHLYVRHIKARLMHANA